MADVRAYPGVPPLAAFGGTVSPTPSTPIIVDSTTGDLYAVIAEAVKVILGANMQLTGPITIVTNSGAADSTSTYVLCASTTISNPSDAKTYDVINASRVSITGTATGSIQTIRGGYFDLASNFNGSNGETSAVSGFNRIDNAALTNPPKMWGGEVHVSKASGVADSQMIAWEAAVHKAPALGAAACVGLLCTSGDFGGITATRAGEAVRIQGNRGWTYGIRYFDTDGATELFAVSQTGAINGTNFTPWAAFTTTRTGWTDVGTPTVTARFCQIRNTVHFQIKVVPATTVATTAGTSYCSLPVTAAGLAGDASMTDLTTLISVGNCVINVANSRVYVPTQVASGDSLLIAGWYEV